MEFHKLQSLGNDFVLLFEPKTDPDEALVKRLGDRHLGIGFDQLLVTKNISQNTWSYTIYNQDGSHAEQCLNGARSVGRFLFEKLGQKNVTLKAGEQSIIVNVLENDQIQVLVDWPQFVEIMPEGWFYSVGNPHWIIDLTDQTWSKETIRNCYQQRPVNVSGVYRHHHNEISLCTYERGTGFTHACGSACVASFAALHDNDLCGNELIIAQKGGCAKMHRQDNQISFEAGATWVYSGQVRSTEQILYQGASRQDRQHSYKEIL